MNTKKGFTLVELLVVIAILAILATVSVVGYTSFIERANESNAQTEAHQIQTTIESYIIAGDVYVLDSNNATPTYFVAEVEVDHDNNAETAKVKLLRVCTYNNTSKQYEVVNAATATNIGDVKAINKDFAGLPGTLAVTANGVLQYTGKNTTEPITIE